MVTTTDDKKTTAADATDATSKKDAKAAKKTGFVHTPKKTTALIHGSEAVTMTNHYHPDSGNPLIVISTGVDGGSVTDQEVKDYVEGSPNGHPGLYEVIDGRKVPIPIVSQTRVPHPTLDGVESVILELKPNLATVRAFSPGELEIVATDATTPLSVRQKQAPKK